MIKRLLYISLLFILSCTKGELPDSNYSFNFKKNLVFGYISNEFSIKELQSKNLFIEVEKKKYSIDIILKPLKQNQFKEI